MRPSRRPTPSRQPAPASIAVGVSNTVGPSVQRLQYISGPVRNSDYFVTNWDALQDTLVSIATEACQGTVTVVKQIRNLDGTTSPGVGWTFSATNNRGPVTPPSGVTSGTGTVNFTVPDSSTATINETQQSGYQLVQQNGSNAVCTSRGQPRSLDQQRCDRVQRADRLPPDSELYRGEFADPGHVDPAQDRRQSLRW